MVKVDEYFLKILWQFAAHGLRVGIDELGVERGPIHNGFG
jgi:hypothetical protein